MPRGKPTVRLTGKAIVQSNVSLAGQALATLVQSLKDNGAEVSNTEFEKAFAHMHSTLATLEEQARRDRKFVSAGAFSFDDPIEIPAPVVRLMPRAPAPAPAPQGTNEVDEVDGPDFGAPVVVAPVLPAAPTLLPVFDFGKPAAPPEPKEWKKPTGRLSRHSPDPDAGQVVHVNLSTSALTEKLADSAEHIAFLGDKNEEL